MGHLGWIDSGCLHVDAKLIQHFGGELRDVPFFRMLVLRAERFHQFMRNIFRDAQRVLFLFFPFERGAANRINGLALFVHYVVIFEQVLAGLEVLRLDGLLRIFDAA